MNVKIYGPWARQRKSFFSIGIDIGDRGVVVGLFFWNIYFTFKER